MSRLAVVQRFDVLRLAVAHLIHPKKDGISIILTGHCSWYFSNIVLQVNETQHRQLFRSIIPNIQITQNAMFFVNIL